MDTHSASAVAILSTIGAATGALSAVIFYAVCIRRRFPLFVPGGGPLNWFEKDLLERAKETAKASTEKFAELGKVGNILGRDPVNNVKDGIFDNIIWQQKNPPYDTISETADNDVPKTPLTPFTPSLLEDTVFSSNERMVVVKVQPKISNGSTLSSTDSDSGYRKQSSWSSSSSLDESGGELQLSLFYDTAQSILSVKLIEVKKQSVRTKNRKAKIRRRMKDLLNGMDKPISTDNLLERIKKRREQQRQYMRNLRADPAYSKIENEKNRIRMAQRRLNEKIRLEENEKNLERMRSKRRNGSVEKKKRKSNEKKQIQEAVNHEITTVQVEEVQITPDLKQLLNNNKN